MSKYICLIKKNYLSKKNPGQKLVKVKKQIKLKLSLFHGFSDSKNLIIFLENINIFCELD